MHVRVNSLVIQNALAPDGLARMADGGLPKSSQKSQCKKEKSGEQSWRRPWCRMAQSSECASLSQ